MHRAATLVLATLVAVGGLTACKNTDDAASDLPRPSAAFCKAAGRFDERVQLTKTTLSEQITMVEAIAASAPKDIAKDANLFLDALEKRKAGDKSVVDNPRIETAANNVLRRAGQDCGWYTRKGM